VFNQVTKWVKWKPSGEREFSYEPASVYLFFRFIELNIEILKQNFSSFSVFYASLIEDVLGTIAHNFSKLSASPSKAIKSKLDDYIESDTEINYNSLMIKTLTLLDVFFWQEFEFAPELYNWFCPILAAIPEQLKDWLNYEDIMNDIYTPTIVSIIASDAN